jgi:ABC-2 type transport system permease protein
MLNLLWQELRARKWTILIWGVALSFFPIIYVGLYPSFADQLAGFQDILDLELYQALGITGMTTFEDYMASTVNNLIPVILAVYAVLTGTAALAGEEEDGRLEMIVALPIPRWQIVTVKAVAIGLSLLGIMALAAGGTALTLISIQSQVDTAATPWGVFINLLSAWPLELAFAMIALFLGAFAPSRRIALSLAGLLVAASFLGNNLIGMIESLQSLQWLSLFHYYDATADAILNGQAWSDILILLAVALVFFGLAVFFFGRRDITVGHWPWGRGRVPASA